MSLINDALKRAQEAPRAPTPNLPLRPADPPAPVRHSLGLLLPVGLALIALLGLFFVWQSSQIPGLVASDPLQAQARSVPALGAAGAGSTGPAGSGQSSAIQPGSSPSPAAPTAANPVVPPGSAATVSASPEANATITNASLTVVEPTPEKPAPLKLQGIVFSPTRPCVLISGRTLFIGDKFLDSRLVAITRNTATFANGEQKTVLTLEP